MKPELKKLSARMDLRGLGACASKRERESGVGVKVRRRGGCERGGREGTQKREGGVGH
jgi:hypothetical protein